MIILGIETSCDDTGISILEVSGSKFKVLANFVSSQVKLHKKYGGVYPTLAKREHRKNLPFLLKKALSKVKNQKIDLVAVTVGPGLEPCLWEGINFAKKFAKERNLFIVPVNHIEAHILINFLKLKAEGPKMKVFFPAICLVVSGGHTTLFLMKKIGDYKLLGQTRDDAAGECLDKVARLLGLGYPGGPAIERFAKYEIQDTRYEIKLPRPMIGHKNYDFSFAGLKTAVLYDFKKRPEKIRKSKTYKILISKETQQAIIDVLIAKTFRAKKEFGAKSIFLGGGVTANKELRKNFLKKAKREKCKIFIPEKNFCLDNGLMIALTGYLKREKKTKKFDKIIANGNLEI
jgi:N6-L-threonylcarbamoyladenine synthase